MPEFLDTIIFKGREYTFAACTKLGDVVADLEGVECPGISTTPYVRKANGDGTVTYVFGEEKK